MSGLTADWNLVIAICVGLIALGHILDVILYRGEADQVRETLEHWSEVLRRTSLREWQMRIATVGTSTLHRLHRTLAVYVGSYLRFAPPEVMPRYAVLTLVRIAFDAIFVFSIAIFWYTAQWQFGVLGLAFLIVLAFGCLRLVLDAFGWPDWTDQLTDYMVTVPMLSAVVAMIAIATATLLPPPAAGAFWFFVDPAGGTEPTRPLLLTSINLPFDLATVVITVRLLQLIQRRGRFIFAIAAMDIALSAVLTFAFYLALKFVEVGVALPSWSLLSDATVRFRDFMLSLGGSVASGTVVAVGDLHLLPLMMTTFVPVTLYMTVFLALSFAKPVMWFSDRLFGGIAAHGKGGTTVFKQFATLLSAITAFAKAVYTYLAG